VYEYIVPTCIETYTIRMIVIRHIQTHVKLELLFVLISRRHEYEHEREINNVKLHFYSLVDDCDCRWEIKIYRWGVIGGGGGGVEEKRTSACTMESDIMKPCRMERDKWRC
jgi:hypothetical protein